MSSTLAKFIKASLGGGAVIGFGYLLMVTTTPTDEQLINSLSPELRQKYEDQKEARREQNRIIYEKIQKEGHSSEAVWRKEPKDLFLSEAERERDVRVRMRQATVDKQLDAERDRMRQLAELEKK